MPRELAMRQVRFGGFTLVELLVVIGIISVLVAILLPALSNARKHAQATQCLSNMRQIGLGLQMYTVENRGWLPPVAPNDVQAPGAAVPPSAVIATTDFGQEPVYSNFPNFLGSLIPYLKGNIGVFKCPSIPNIQEYFPNDKYYTPDAASDTTYLGNAAVLGRQISNIRGSSEVAYLQEQPYRWGAAVYRPTPYAIPGLYWYFHDNVNGGVSGFEFQYSNNHFKGGNLVFVDGHAEYRKRSEIKARDFGLTGDGAGPDPATGFPTDTNTTPASATYRSRFPLKPFTPPTSGVPMPVSLPPAS
jgi:prepilin-type N-terminal cleavage/methylation domain-containing protein/prepilin-type processing-associated H-X9-DG protein